MRGSHTRGQGPWWKTLPTLESHGAAGTGGTGRKGPGQREEQAEDVAGGGGARVGGGHSSLVCSRLWPPGAWLVPHRGPFLGLVKSEPCGQHPRAPDSNTH